VDNSYPRKGSNVSNPCIVVAIITPQPDHYDEVLAVLTDVTPDVHHEAGCELYAIHEEVNGRILFVEKWTTRQLWQEHLGLDTVARIKAGVAGKLQEDINVMEMYGAPVGDPARGAL